MFVCIYMNVWGVAVLGLDSHTDHNKRQDYTAHMCDINSTSRGNILAPNRRNLLPSTIRTVRQRLCNQRVGLSAMDCG